VTVVDHWRPGTGSFAKFTYTYDAVGNRDSVTASDGLRTSYLYDDSNRLIAERYFFGPASSTITHSYDAVGNRLRMVDENGSSISFVYDAANQLTSDDSPADYTYDAAGNLAQVVRPTGVTTLTWSAENRLVTYQEPDTLAGVEIYAYDGDGKRIFRLAGDGTVLAYLWDGENVLAEQGLFNDPQTLYTLEPQQYGNLLSEQRLIDEVPTDRWYHFDVLGSTRCLTESSFAPPEIYHYEAYGRPLSWQVGDLYTPYRWVGQLGYQMNAPLGLGYQGGSFDYNNYHVRARNYCAYTGAWISEDPIGIMQGGDANP